MKRYTVLLEHPTTEIANWSAYCPDLPGCIATGDSEQQLMDLMAEAIEFHLEGLVLHGEAIPEPTVRAVELAVREPAASAA